MKKGDIILVLVILLVAGSAFGIYTFLSGHDGGAVVIYVDGEEEGRYRLDKDRTVEINGGTNTLRIDDGSARMETARCPDQICVRHKAISRNGENIICLPYKIVVSIEEGEDTDVDAVVQ